MRRSTSPILAAANNPAYSDSWTAEQTTGIWVEWHEIGPLMKDRGSCVKPGVRARVRWRWW